jgi:hypothetical protein
MLLTMAAEAWNRACQAREILAEDGILLGRDGVPGRVHPCIAVERDARIAFAGLIAQDATSGPECPCGHAQYAARWLESIKWSNGGAASRESTSSSPTR